MSLHTESGAPLRQIKTATGNRPYRKIYNELGELLNPITKDIPYQHPSISRRQFRLQMRKIGKKHAHKANSKQYREQILPNGKRIYHLKKLF